MQYLIYSVMLVISVATIILTGNQTIQSISTSLAGAFILFFINESITHRAHLKLWWYSFRYRNQEIRLSIAYLFRIKIDNQYLLVKSQRRNTHQPPGGVYKRLPSSKTFFEEICIKEENNVNYDPNSDNDLRIRIKGKYLSRFFKWLDQAKGREISPWREFYEELLFTNILSSENFPYIQYEFIRRKQSDITKTYGEQFEIHVADIYELLPDDKQKKELDALKDQDSDQFILADENTIKHDKTIGEHSFWII